MDRGIPSPMRCPIPSLVRKCPYAASIVPRNPINLPYRHLYVENASQMGPNCGVRVREVSSVIGRAGQLHGGAGPE